MINEIMIFDAIKQFMKENYKVVNISNDSDEASYVDLGAYSRCFKCETGGVTLRWGKRHGAVTMKEEDVREEKYDLYLDGSNVCSYNSNSYTVNFMTDRLGLNTVHQQLGKPRLRID